MDNALWEKISAKSHASWLELRDPCQEVGSTHYWWCADVRFDGCVTLFNAGNVPFGDAYGHASDQRDHPACDDSFHICDIDDLIARLQALKTAALEHFGPDWPR